jgi:D-proline reductase (dithiol) PrdB
MVEAAPEKFVTDVAWDRDSTHTDDRESFLPINAASVLASDGVFAGLTEHFIGAPTVYSQAMTLDVHAPEILAKLRADGADGAILSAL